MNKPEKTRQFSLFLHGHLPWVLHHGQWPHGAEWLCEATIATYLPLVRCLQRLREKGIEGGITLGVSPVLAEQLSAPAFRTMFHDYLEERVRTSGQEATEFERRGEAAAARLARRWESAYRETGRFFNEDLGADLLGALADLEASGTLEIATCGATHGYLPLLGRDESIGLQIELARRVHERHFGRAPRGIWLPEAAYRPGGPWCSATGDSSVGHRPGIEKFLARSGLRYFVVDSGLLHGGVGVASSTLRFAGGTRVAASPDPTAALLRRGTADTRHSYWIAPRDGEVSEVAFFTRDPRTGLQVWSGTHGYPGDPAFLEFHRKSENGGHRYWKVTGPNVDLGAKELYDPAEAEEHVAWQADHFRDVVAATLEGSDDGSILVAPYDAELFGHWWYEGTTWIEKVLEGFHRDPRVELTTLGSHLENHPPRAAIELPEGSWGDGGNHDVWTNPQVDWSWKLIYPLENEVWDLWDLVREEGATEARRVAGLAMKEFLLLAASDWQFLITTGTAADYATERIRKHADELARLTGIARRLLDSPGDWSGADRDFVGNLERRDRLFPEIEEAIVAATGGCAACAG